MNYIKQNKVKILKIAIGSLLAFLAANALKLDYAISTPIITILTLQNTKKETLLVALRRIASFVFASLLAYLLFTTLGHTPLVFGLFILFFSAVCFLFHIEDGFVSSTVLATHMYSSEAITLSILQNETLILIIGMGIGILLNAFMENNQHIIQENQRKIENLFSNMLEELSKQLDQHQHTFSSYAKEAKDVLYTTRQQAIENQDNTLSSSTTYYLDYVSMRFSQLERLLQINQTLNDVAIPSEFAKPIIIFMKDIASSLHEYNNVKGLLDEMDEIYKLFKEKELPATRQEFEKRAVLFSILLELQTFLLTKRQFVLQHQEE